MGSGWLINGSCSLVVGSVNSGLVVERLIETFIILYLCTGLCANIYTACLKQHVCIDSAAYVCSLLSMLFFLEI